MLVGKRFKLLMSATLPNSSIVSVEFQTYLEEDSEDPQMVFQKAYDATMSDVVRTIKNDKIVRTCWKKLKKGVATEIKLTED